MKKFIALIVAVALVVVGGLLFLIGGLYKTRGVALSNNLKVQSLETVEKEYNAKGEIQKLDLYMASEDVEILPYDGEFIHVTYNDLKDDSMFSFSESGNTLTIKRNTLNSISFFSFNWDVIPPVRIMIPKGLLDSVDVDTASGDVSISDITFTDIVKIDAASGDIKLTNLNTEDSVNINTASGDVSINKLNAKKSIAVNSASGDIKLTTVSSNKNISLSASSGEVVLEDVSSDADIKVSTTSGDLNYDTITAADTFIRSSSSGETIGTGLKCSSLDANSTSGDFRLKNTTVDNKVDMEASSGNISLKLNDSPNNYNTTIRTSSGDSNYGSHSSSTATKELSIKTTSGDVDLRFAE